MHSIDSILEDGNDSSSLLNSLSEELQTQKKELEPFPTKDSQSIFLHLSSQSLNWEVSSQHKQIKNQQQRPMQIKAKQKRLIEVSRQNRHAYLESKKGKLSHSNGLTTHIISLIKSNFEEYKIFFCTNQNQTQFIQRFQQSNDNLNSLRKLLIESHDLYEESVSKSLENKAKFAENLVSFNDFLSEKFQNPKIAFQILLKKRMSFSKKLLLIRCLKSLKKTFESPEALKSWKSLLIN